MRCHLLQGKYMIFCIAVKEGYIPSTFELDEYCRQDKHKTCPLYRQAKNDEELMTTTDIPNGGGRTGANTSSRNQER